MGIRTGKRKGLSSGRPKSHRNQQPARKKKKKKKWPIILRRSAKKVEKGRGKGGKHRGRKKSRPSPSHTPWCVKGTRRDRKGGRDLSFRKRGGKRVRNEKNSPKIGKDAASMFQDVRGKKKKRSQRGPSCPRREQEKEREMSQRGSQAGGWKHRTGKSEKHPRWRGAREKRKKGKTLTQYRRPHTRT